MESVLQVISHQVPLPQLHFTWKKQTRANPENSGNLVSFYNDQ